MAVVKAVHSRASIGNAINYITKEEKTKDHLISGIYCSPFNAVDEMKMTKMLYDKMDGRQYEHYVQSFHADEKVTPKQAHEIAVQWAEEMFPNHEVIVSTHQEKKHLHSHIIVNSVSFEDGSKLHHNARWLQEAKDRSDEICREQGLTICQKGRDFYGNVREDMTSFDRKKYEVLEQADKGKVKSYVLDIAEKVMSAKEQAVSREDFIERLQKSGIRTTWKDSRKAVTFEDEQGNKVRDTNLENTFHISFGKESLEHEFEQNARREQNRTTEQYADIFRRVAENERRASEARESISERFGHGAGNRSNQGVGQSAEEGRSYDVRTREGVYQPSQAVRELTERVQRESLEARRNFKENLTNLVEARTGHVQSIESRKRKISELNQRKSELERELSEKSRNKGRQPFGHTEEREERTQERTR